MPHKRQDLRTSMGCFILVQEPDQHQNRSATNVVDEMMSPRPVVFHIPWAMQAGTMTTTRLPFMNMPVPPPPPHTGLDALR